MRARLFTLTTVATLAMGVWSVPSEAGVVTPADGVRQSAQSLNWVQQVRRVCYKVPRCDLHNGCFMAQQCDVTADYPPERGVRRQARRAVPAGEADAPAAQAAPAAEPDSEPAQR